VKAEDNRTGQEQIMVEKTRFLNEERNRMATIFVPPSCDEDDKDKFKKTYLNASNAQIIVDQNKQILKSRQLFRWISMG